MQSEYPKTLFKNGKFDGEQKEVKDGQEEARARVAGFSDRYTHQDYPRSMHLDGDRSKPERIVNDEDEEAAARAEGFYTLHEVESGQVSVAPDPELEHLPADVLAAVKTAGKDSVIGRALLAQFPAPSSDKKSRKGNKDD